MTETTTAVSTVSVGLPSGLDPEKVRDRKIALIAAGTEPLLAEKLAIDAETLQVARDASLKPVIATVEVPVIAEVPIVAAEPLPATAEPLPGKKGAKK